MAAKSKTVYQFKISLCGVEPLIWRRIQVPENYSFWDLHVAIQDVMGWWDYHLHVFRPKNKHHPKVELIGIPDDSGFDKDIKAGWDIAISGYFSELGTTFVYEYDFGDGWTHEVILEGHLLREKGVKYPICIDGARACPPEDCGGVPGYNHLLATLKGPKNKKYKEMVQWLGGKYDPEHFDAKAIRFDNPKKRLKKAFGPE